MGNVFRVINSNGDIEITIYKKANAVFKTNEYNETDNICTYKETINIFNLLQENYELKLQLKGTTHCFDEEEHEKLKKQLEKVLNDYCRLDAYNRTQQKEFVEYLEDFINKTDYEVNILGNYPYLAWSKAYQKILSKYKEIIGGNKDE